MTRRGWVSDLGILSGSGRPLTAAGRSRHPHADMRQGVDKYRDQRKRSVS
ncbi:hypothetical protein Ae168Ps1_6101c [Pseudonocardia sp. Ae168_Ps1]|nr:hypothetical protein Ae168Ps1_6101c [Pseudonocardia sp. Ae168_Ps1]OLM09799.1 hypothetical protein Ae706Ps2_6261 [Pseudonocardia sp. Ae706_Ps2]